MAKKKKKQVINLYRRISLSFIILTVILVVIVLYFSFSKATIYITPSDETISTNFILDIVENDKLSGEDQIQGKILVQEFEDSVLNFPSSGTKNVPTDVVGYVTIFNNYSKNQPLVATTRLLSPKGELFRIKSGVNVPAGGKIENIEVYADDPESIEFPVLPTRFTIPGLWEGLQDKIYAQSFNSFNVGELKVKVVSSNDIERAQKTIKDVLLSKAQQEFEKQVKSDYPGYTVEIAQVEVIKSESTAEEGDELDQFGYSMALKATALVFNEQDMLDLAKAKIAEKIPDDKELKEVDLKSFVYNIDKYDPETKSASVNVYLEGRMRIKMDSPLLDKENFTGMSQKEVIAYLTEFPEIQEAEVRFSPFWVKRVPKLADHIYIVFRIK